MSNRLENTIDNEQPNLKLWTAVIFLTILIHLLFFFSSPWFAKLSDFFRTTQVRPMPIETIDMNKLQAMRKGQKHLLENEPKSLLIQPDDPKAKNDTKVPENYRYESNRNQTVEKEMRSRNSQLLPTQNSAASLPQKPVESSKAPAKTSPKLSDLGLSYKVKPKPQKLAEQPARPQERVTPAPGSRAQSANQTLLDDQLAEGDQNLLNTKESVYYSFYSRVYEAIAPLWESLARDVPRRQRLHMGDYDTVAEVVIDLDGNLVSTQVLQGSGVYEFDQAATQPWKRLNRFPNPPKKMAEAKDGLVHMVWRFRFRVMEGSPVQFMPPARYTPQ